MALGQLHHLHPVTIDQVAAELLREEDQRRSFYPGRVEALRMTQAEADHQMALIAAWREDLARIAALRARAAADYATFLMTGSWPAIPSTPPAHGLDWRTRRSGLARELRMRDRVYPDWIAGGRMTRDQADHRIACLSALAETYDDGWDWTASNGGPPGLAILATDDTTRAAALEWESHMAEIMARRAPDRQKEMAL
jgi:hypothetical protein